MTTPDHDDAFERRLREALDPGEIALTTSQREELSAAFAAVARDLALPEESRELAEFSNLLAEALNPGEIEFGPARRRELLRQMAGTATGEALTAWALGEMPNDEREAWLRRLETSPDLRVEALSLQRFCDHLASSLPPLPRPGWRERARLRYVVFGSSRRWLGAAAALAALATATWSVHRGSSTAVVSSVSEIVVKSTMPTSAPAAVVENGAQVPAPVTASRATENGLLPLPVPSAHFPAFPFEELPVPPVSRQVTPAEPRPHFDATGLVARLVHGETSTATEPSPSAMGTSMAASGGPEEVLLASREVEGGRAGQAQLPGGKAPVAGPDLGTVALGRLQPFVMPGLLGGSPSGRPEAGAEGRWIAADFRVLDPGSLAGGGAEAGSWSAEAGMGWQLSPELQAGLSFGGIDARLEVPGFGEVEAQAVSFGASLDWRHEGYHAALAYDAGLFDQDLKRRSAGLVHPADQEATVHRLSLWLTREFGGAAWKHGPVVGVDGSWGHFDDYQELFPGGVGVAGRDFQSMTTLLGWQTWGRFDSAAGPWFPHVVAGWRHRPVVPDAAIVQGRAGIGFAAPVGVPERDSLLLEVGTRWLPGDGPVFFDAIGSGEWRSGGGVDHTLLLKLGVSF